MGDRPHVLSCNSLVRLCIIQSEVTFLRVGPVQEGVAAFLPRAETGKCARQPAVFPMHAYPGCLATYWLFFPTERCARVSRRFLAAELRAFFFFLLKYYFIALNKSSSLFTEGKSISADVIKNNHFNE